jgi:hypothetical protein
MHIFLRCSHDRESVCHHSKTRAAYLAIILNV